MHLEITQFFPCLYFPNICIWSVYIYIQPGQHSAKCELIEYKIAGFKKHGEWRIQPIISFCKHDTNLSNSVYFALILERKHVHFQEKSSSLNTQELLTSDPYKQWIHLLTQRREKGSIGERKTHLYSGYLPSKAEHPLQF